jgi:hypothetical protein
MVSNQVKTRWGYQRSELFNQLERLENQMRAAIPPAALQAIQELAARQPG